MTRAIHGNLGKSGHDVARSMDLSISIERVSDALYMLWVGIG